MCVGVKEERRGEGLFNLILEFSNRYSKDHVGSRTEVFDALEKVFDIAERCLDPIEKRSAMAVVTYLRARKTRKMGSSM